MPKAPPQPCRHLGCPALVFAPYCEAHSEAKDPVRYRGSAASRGYDSDWEKVRQQALRRDKFICRACLVEGRTTPAKDVDHIVPLAVDPARRLDLTNLQSLCRPCHRHKTEQ